MAIVYEISIGEFQGRPGDGPIAMTMYSSLLLMDGDEFDTWVSTNFAGASLLGDGNGMWVRSSSTNSVEIRDDDGAGWLASMAYKSWPLHYMDYGKIRLAKPAHGRPSGCGEEAGVRLRGWPRSMSW